MKTLTRKNLVDLHLVLLSYRHNGLVRMVDLLDLDVKTEPAAWVLDSFRHKFNVPGWRKYGDWDGQDFQAFRVDFDGMMAAIAERFDCHPADLLLSIEET